MQNNQRLTDKVIVITGSAGGIGGETARWLAAEGALLILADRNEQGLKQTHALISSISSDAVAVTMDVSERASWEILLAQSLKQFGHVDVLVNCAGVLQPEPVGGLTELWLRRQIEVNLLGTIYGTEVFLPHFRRRQKGHFIHIASLGGIAPLPGSAIYSATKFGVRGFCLALGLELQGTPIKVSVICPDSVNTPQLRHEALNGGSPLSFTSSFLKPADVAKAILKTILKPKEEILVPRFRGWMARLGNFSPAFMALVYPILDKIGRRGRQKFVERILAQSMES